MLSVMIVIEACTKSARGVYISPSIIWGDTTTNIIIKSFTHIKAFKMSKAVIKFYALGNSVFAYFVKNSICQGLEHKMHNKVFGQYIAKDAQYCCDSCNPNEQEGVQ